MMGQMISKMTARPPMSDGVNPFFPGIQDAGSLIVSNNKYSSLHLSNNPQDLNVYISRVVDFM
jgi:hypothetical protein